MKQRRSHGTTQAGYFFPQIIGLEIYDRNQVGPVGGVDAGPTDQEFVAGLITVGSFHLG